MRKTDFGLWTLDLGYGRKLLAAIFVVYLVVVAAITIVPTRVTRPRFPRSDHIHLVPFGYSFKCLLRERRRANPDLTAYCLRNNLGNIALFLPLGILLPLLFRRIHSLKRVVLTAALVSLSIETIQFFSAFFGNSRAVDIDDVLLNTLGACIGFGIYAVACRRQTVDSKQ